MKIAESLDQRTLENFSGGVLIFIGIIATFEHLFEVQLVFDSVTYLGAAAIILLTVSYLKKAVERLV